MNLTIAWAYPIAFPSAIPISSSVSRTACTQSGRSAHPSLRCVPSEAAALPGRIELQPKPLLRLPPEELLGLVQPDLPGLSIAHGHGAAVKLLVLLFCISLLVGLPARKEGIIRFEGGPINRLLYSVIMPQVVEDWPDEVVLQIRLYVILQLLLSPVESVFDLCEGLFQFLILVPLWLL